MTLLSELLLPRYIELSSLEDPFIVVALLPSGIVCPSCCGSVDLGALVGCVSLPCTCCCGSVACFWACCCDEFFGCFVILALYFVFGGFVGLDFPGVFVLLAGLGGGACGRGEAVTGGTPTSLVGAGKIGVGVMVFCCGAGTVGNGLGEDEAGDGVGDVPSPDAGDGVVDEAGGSEGVVADGFAATTGADGRSSPGSALATAIGRGSPGGTLGCLFADEEGCFTATGLLLLLLLLLLEGSGCVGRGIFRLTFMTMGIPSRSMTEGVCGDITLWC